MPRSDAYAKLTGLRRFGTWAASTRGDRAIVASCAVLLACLVAAAQLATFPGAAGMFSGKDQGFYLQAARAWAAFDLSPARHHYLPGYPLLGAPFVWLTPRQPFLLPDLLCLLASLAVFVRIGRRLAPEWGDAAPALAFTVAVLSGKWMFLWLWVMPWSSTGSAPLQFAALLLALRLGERVAAGRAFALGLCVALIGAFRPSDAGVLAAGCGLYAVAVLWQRRVPPRVWGRVAIAGGLGVLAGGAPWMAAHAAIFGAGPGPYMAKVASIGFEWRLLPLRWVMLVIDPRPLLPTGNGVAEVLPWVAPGIAGMILSLLPRAGHRVAPAALVAGTVTLHWCLYLTYRDLNAEGIWRFALIHYFKWTFPFLVLWAAQFAAALFGARAGRTRVALAAALGLVLFLWRPLLRHPQTIAVTSNASGVRLSDTPSLVNQALALNLTGSWDALHDGVFTLRTGDAAWISEIGNFNVQNAALAGRSASGAAAAVGGRGGGVGLASGGRGLGRSGCSTVSAGGCFWGALRGVSSPGGL